MITSPTFRYLVLHDRQDAVTIFYDAPAPVGTSVVSHFLLGSDTALQAAAVASGKTTWDNDSVCTLYGLVRAPLAAVVLPTVASVSP